MGADDVFAAYGAQARRVADLLGVEVGADDPARALIESWASTVDGPILDVGSGTGRWSGHLARLGHDIEGLEPVAELVEVARLAHPTVAFHVASIADLAAVPAPAGKWAGILAWYSVIHFTPAELARALAVLRGVLDAGGSLLLSFFAGHRLESIAHPIAPAYRWPLPAMIGVLQDAGFEVVSQFWEPPGPYAVVVARAVA